MTHTKGKWETRPTQSDLDIAYDIENETEPICAVYRKPEAQANAKLIAAAPELLEALTEIFKTYREMQSEPHYHLLQADIKKIMDESKAAIKKATI